MMRLIPNFKGFDFFPHDTRLPFMRYKGICFGLSIAAMLISLAIIGVKSFNYGVDFKGGSLIEVQSNSGPADVAHLRERLNRLGVGAVQLQSFGGPTDVLIRVEQQPGGEGEQQAALKKVQEALGTQYTQRRVEVVGPAVSSELRMTGFIAVAAGLLAIVAYVWFRFEWQYAPGAVLALVHDVCFTAGLFSFFGWEFDMNVLAALLVIIGYSMNDTIVIYDRIRETVNTRGTTELESVVNEAINSTLSRTILTSGITQLVVVALLLLGGPVLRGFALALFIGILVGTYSSVYVASAVLIWLSRRYGHPVPAAKPERRTRPSRAAS